MASKMKTKPTVSEPHVIEQPIDNALEINYMPYTMSVIVSRAIPEIDGFKPAHRKLLYTMYKMGLLTGGRVKSADVVGQTMRLNPHGEIPIYDTLMRLTRGHDALLHPFIDSKGNFGKQYSRDMACAASRYTEVKLDGICAELFKDIDKNNVDMVDNYNNTTTEPVLLPTTFPNVLVTANTGIAVGMASKVCSFNLKEVCLTAAAFIADEKHLISKTLLAPDLATGGELLFSSAEIENIYQKGEGGFKVRARYRFDKKNNCIEVYEIPYTTTIEAIIDKIALLVKNNKVRDITDVRDETDLNGLKIAIDIKKTANPELIMQKLYNQTTLSDTFSCNFNILVNSKPRVMGVAEILREWTVFRVGCLKRQYLYDINKKTEKLHLIDGLTKIMLDIDKAIAIIRNTATDALVIPNLMDGFIIDRDQAEFVAEIRLRNLNKEYLLNRIGEKDQLKKEIDELNDLLGSDQKIKAVICAQLKEIAKKYGAPRRTEIIYEHQTQIVEEDELVDDYGVKIFLTEKNYFKKIPLTSMRAAGEQYVKEDDRVVQELETGNRSDILFFSDKCAVYKAKVYDLPECKPSGLGEYLTNLLQMEENEKILYIVCTLDYKGFLIAGFENGKVAKIEFESYSTKMNRKKLINAYSDKSKPVMLRHVIEDADFYVQRASDKALVFNTSLIAASSTKNAQGVQVMRLKQRTAVTIMSPASETPMIAGDDDSEFYRAAVIPAAGHFIKSKQISIC
ncbi:MAG: DNA topoisomerase (ATP-hydrolyzing) subunit A [Defluviitaleaceae bacterium]|nr:DNA topoisomerase (ATP-hydrolyzing) subunit A [Defluviitaleaceae bacterium]